MDDARAMNDLQRLGDPRDEQQYGLDGQFAVLGDRVGEEGPGTYAVASQGCSASGSASMTGAVNSPWTRCAAWTSWAKRRRNSASWPKSGRITLMATGRPPGVYDR